MIYAWLLFSFRGRVNRARYLVVQLALLTFWLVLWPKFSFHFSSQWEALQWVRNPDDLDQRSHYGQAASRSQQERLVGGGYSDR